jgi:hypothetical protein
MKFDLFKFSAKHFWPIFWVVVATCMPMAIVTVGSFMSLGQGQFLGYKVSDQLSFFGIAYIIGSPINILALFCAFSAIVSGERPRDNYELGWLFVLAIFSALLFANFVL